MLLAVEGGGFFSSSASGYSKGLMLLLFGQKNEERPMKVLPWNQYHLVVEEVKPKDQLASSRKRISCRRPFFVCLGCSSVGGDQPASSSEAVTQQCKGFPNSTAASDKRKAINNAVVENGKELCLKSNLKKHQQFNIGTSYGVDDSRHSLEQTQSNASCSSDRRKVQWTDAHGRDLTQIREFEPSEVDASEDEYERQGLKRCHCVIQ